MNYMKMREQKLVSFLSNKILPFILLTVSLLMLSACGKVEGTTMRLVRYTGTVMLEGAGQKDAVSENMRLFSGNVLNTAIESNAFISIDDQKAVTMDQNSRAEFVKDGNKISIDLTKGDLFFVVSEPLPEDETFEICTYTMAVGIRGTSGYVEAGTDGTECLIITDGKVIVTLIDPASGESVNIEVSAREKLIVRSDPEPETDEAVFDISRIDSGDLPNFVKEIIKSDNELLEDVLRETGWNEIANAVPEDMTTGRYRVVPGNIIDGVAWGDYYLDLSDGDKLTLDRIIDLCESGDERSAAYLLPDESFQETFSVLGEACKTMLGNNHMYRIVYRDYKISGVVIGTQWELYMIPVSDGVGYAIGYRDNTSAGGPYEFDNDIFYGTCECSDGMFNGSFSLYGIHEVPVEMLNGNYSRITGEVKYGYLNGELKGIALGNDFDGLPISEIVSYYEKGIPLVIGTTSSGDDAYTIVRKDGQEYYTYSSASWQPGFHYIFSVFGGWQCLGGLERQSGTLGTYPF